MQFKDIIGQQSVKHHLAEMVQHNRLSHALLFLGKEGTGALLIAIAFAQYLVCEKAGGRSQSGDGNEAPSLFTEPEADKLPTPASELPADPCGTCPSCTKAARLVHPDIHFS